MYECCVEGMNFEEFFEGEVAQYYCWLDACVLCSFTTESSGCWGSAILDKPESAVQKATG